MRPKTKIDLDDAEAREEREHIFTAARGIPLERDPDWTRATDDTGQLWHWAEAFGWRRGEFPVETNVLRVDRATWLRGEGPTPSRLLRSGDMKRCCLGFMAQQLGASDEEILDHQSPAAVSHLPWPTEFLDGAGNSMFGELLMGINDFVCDGDRAQEIRERDLEQALAQIGWSVEFTG